MLLARISLYTVSAVFVGFGLMSLFFPQNLTTLVEIAMPTNVAVMEVRGVYGGLFLGTALLFFLFAGHDAWMRPGLIAQASIMGGLVLGRTAGIILDGSPNSFIALRLGDEIVGLVVALGLPLALNLPGAEGRLRHGLSR